MIGVKEEWTGDIMVDDIIKRAKSDNTKHSLCNVTWFETFERVYKLINMPKDEYLGFLEKCMKASSSGKDSEYDELIENIKKSDKFFKEYQDGLKERLKIEIKDGTGMCFTGRITRLINVFTGYHPDIRINISGASQIAAKITATETHVLKTHFISDKDFWNVLEKALYENLSEIDLSEEDIKEWIEPMKEKYCVDNERDDEYHRAKGGGAMKDTEEMKGDD